MRRTSWAWLAAVVLLAGAVSCARSGPPPAAPTPAYEQAAEAPEARPAADGEPARRRPGTEREATAERPDPWEFEIRHGMRRSAVEEVLGSPTHVGTDRNGRVHCLHSIDGRWRSVLYDARGRVVEVHP